MGDYDPSPDQDVDSDSYSISVEGPGGQADYEDPHQFNGFGPFHYHDQSASSAPNIPTDVLQPNFDDLRMAGLPHSYPSQFPSPEGPISGGDSLVASLDGLDLDHTIIPPPWTQFLHPSHHNLPRLHVPPTLLPPSFPRSATSEHSFLAPYNGASPFHSPSSPDPSYLSAGSGSGTWSPHPDRIRPRSHSASGNLAPHSWPLRGMSPGSSEYGSEDNYFSDASSVFSEDASTTSEHINPQLLSNHVLTAGGSSSGYSSGYSNESSSPLPTSVDLPADNSTASPSRRVASTKTRNAAQKRRKKDARFHCSVPGCGGSFTARHNLINHENSHNGVRNFVCIPCDTAFITSAVLKRHMKTCKGKA